MVFYIKKIFRFTLVYVPLFVFIFPKPLLASPNQSALLSIAQQLHCAKTESDSQVLLSTLISIPTSPFGIPSDNFDQGDSYFLYAATVDILLQQLLETSQRFPSLQESAERTALLWNFCEIISGGQLVDLTINADDEIIKKSSVKPFPAKQQGFRRWGFLNPDPDNRYVPKLLDMPNFPLSQQNILFRTFVKQCFPHPDTGKLFTELKEPERIGKLRMEKAFLSGQAYPYHWKFDCNPPAPEIIQQKIEPAPIINIEPKIEAKPIKVVDIALVKTVEAAVEKAVKIEFEAEPIKEIEPELDLHLDLSSDVGLEITPEFEPLKDDTPLFSIANSGSGSNSSNPLPLPIKDGYGFTGNVYHNSTLTGTLSVGANASWTPHSYFFIRGGINYKYYPDEGVFSYSWGIGYDDWHPGTFSFQLNNWGPILPEEGLAFDKAVADIGYKFEAEFLKPYKISGSASFVIPVEGDQQLSTTWSWSPFDYWFVRVSFQTKPFNYDGITWSYGFGYSDWHPFTAGIAYNNWGPNSLTDGKSDGVNFKENGLISLTFSWAF